MIWPGTGDPYKRKKTIKFLAITAGIGAITVIITLVVVNPSISEQPRHACINDIDVNWKIEFTVEIMVDNKKIGIPSNVGFMEGGCQRAIYTLDNDGKVYAEWIEDPGFEIGHFLWIFKVPLRDRVTNKSVIYVNGEESPHYSEHPLHEVYHYRVELVSKDFDTLKDKDFLPEEN